MVVGVDDELEVRAGLEVVEFEAHEVEIGLAAVEPTRAARKRVVDACIIWSSSDVMRSYIGIIVVTRERSTRVKMFQTKVVIV